MQNVKVGLRKIKDLFNLLSRYQPVPSEDKMEKLATSILGSVRLLNWLQDLFDQVTVQSTDCHIQLVVVENLERKELEQVAEEIGADWDELFQVLLPFLLQLLQWILELTGVEEDDGSDNDDDTGGNDGGNGGIPPPIPPTPPGLKYDPRTTTRC